MIRRIVFPLTLFIAVFAITCANILKSAFAERPRGGRRECSRSRSPLRAISKERVKNTSAKERAGSLPTRDMHLTTVISHSSPIDSRLCSNNVTVRYSISVELFPILLRVIVRPLITHAHTRTHERHRNGSRMSCN